MCFQRCLREAYFMWKKQNTDNKVLSCRQTCLLLIYIVIEQKVFLDFMLPNDKQGLNSLLTPKSPVKNWTRRYTEFDMTVWEVITQNSEKIHLI